MIQTIISVIATSILTTIIIAITLKRTFKAFAEEFVEIIGETFTGPMTKRAMSILGQKSGDVRAKNAIVEEISEGAINNFIGKWKIPLSLVGVDIDALRERYSDFEILAAAKEFMPLIQGMLPAKGLKGLMGQDKPGVLGKIDET